MRFFLFFLAATLCGFSFVSCSGDKNEIVDENVKVLTTFSMSSNAETRAYWNSGYIFWNSDDKVKVFVQHHEDEEGDVFSILNYTENKEKLTFQGMTYPHGYYRVVYPAACAHSLNSDGTVRVTIPDQQQAKPTTFDPSACIQIGGVDNLGQNVELDHVCAFLKIEVTAPCDWVEVSPNAENYGIVGTVDVSYQSAIDPSEGWVDRKHTVRLNNLPESGYYLIAIGPSDNYKGGITVKVKYPDIDVIEKSLTKDQSFTRGYVYSLGRCNKPGHNS